MTDRVTIRCPDCKTEFDDSIIRLHLVIEHNAPTGLLKHVDVARVHRIVRSLSEELELVRSEVLAIHHPREDGACASCFVAHPCGTAKAVEVPA